MTALRKTAGKPRPVRRTAANRHAAPTPAADTLALDLQVRSRARHVPSRRAFAQWVQAALAGRVTGAAELTLRVVGPAEMQTLNREYRDKDYATNVLSFPFEVPAGIELPVRVLGDIVLCAQTVQREAREQEKPVQAHWAHLTVHGVLHLLGMDHMTTREARAMESAEIAVLKELGFGNPYE
ncbi:MAG: rRNA maturation RNase YbeY [Pseudomonadota bacterium]